MNILYVRCVGQKPTLGFYTRGNIYALIVLKKLKRRKQMSKPIISDDDMDDNFVDLCNYYDQLKHPFKPIFATDFDGEFVDPEIAIEGPGFIRNKAGDLILI